MRATLFCLTTLVLPAYPAPPSMPPWLTPYPGAEPSISSTSTTSTARYSTPAPPASILAHYQTLFAAAGIAFQPNDDGIGQSIRAAVPGCGLLLTIREAASGTAVQAVCTAPSASPAAGSPVNVPVENRAAPSLTRFGQPSLQSPSMEEARRRARENHQRAMAEAEARSRQRTDAMRKYDKPVYPRSTPANSLRNDDAPPLQWPYWLTAKGTSQPVRPVARLANGERSLEFSYRTAIAMTEIYQYYDDLLKSNGFTVHRAKLGTGQTSTGIVQNNDGYVEGSRSEDGTVSGPLTIVRVTFGRLRLNDAISVRLSVRMKGSFRRR